MSAESEIDTWQRATSDVRPLKKKRILPKTVTPEELRKKPIKPKAGFVVRASARSLYDAKLDLHGLTEAGAHQLLMEFVYKQAKRGARKLLIITGKGSGKAGVLRANVPRWLDVEPLCNSISSVEPAPDQLGPDGAFLIRLKKPR